MRPSIHLCLGGESWFLATNFDLHSLERTGQTEGRVVDESNAEATTAGKRRAPGGRAMAARRGIVERAPRGM
jgi:hypothetical protein